MDSLSRLTMSTEIAIQHFLSLGAYVADVDKLHASSVELDDSDSRYLVDLPNLTHLVLAETKITDNSLDSIKGLALLELLDLSETPITDAVATVLYRLPRVRILGLYATRITDLAMESISKLPRLESLNISLNPQITDSGFSCLANSRQLKSVEIHGTEISDAAVKEFSIQYPNVLIVTDAGPVRGIA